MTEWLYSFKYSLKQFICKMLCIIGTRFNIFHILSSPTHLQDALEKDLLRMSYLVPKVDG